MEKLNNNIFYQSIEKESASTLIGHLRDDLSHRKIRFSYTKDAKIDQKQFEIFYKNTYIDPYQKEYCSIFRWSCKKISSAVLALFWYGTLNNFPQLFRAVCNIMLVAWEIHEGIFSCNSIDWRNLRWLQTDIYSLVHNMQVAGAHLLTIFNDKVGRYYLDAALFEKYCLENRRQGDIINWYEKTNDFVNLLVNEHPSSENIQKLTEPKEPLNLKMDKKPSIKKRANEALTEEFGWLSEALDKNEKCIMPKLKELVKQFDQIILTFESEVSEIEKERWQKIIKEEKNYLLASFFLLFKGKQDAILQFDALEDDQDRRAYFELFGREIDYESFSSYYDKIKNKKEFIKGWIFALPYQVDKASKSDHALFSINSDPYKLKECWREEDKYNSSQANILPVLAKGIFEKMQKTQEFSHSDYRSLVTSCIKRLKPISVKEEMMDQIKNAFFFFCEAPELLEYANTYIQFTARIQKHSRSQWEQILIRSIIFKKPEIFPLYLRCLRDFYSPYKEHIDICHQLKNFAKTLVNISFSEDIFKDMPTNEYIFKDMPTEHPENMRLPIVYYYFLQDLDEEIEDFYKNKITNLVLHEDSKKTKEECEKVHLPMEIFKEMLPEIVINQFFTFLIATHEFEIPKPLRWEIFRLAFGFKNIQLTLNYNNSEIKF